MTLTPRRRAAIAVLIGFPVGWLYVDIGWRLLFDLLFYLRDGQPEHQKGDRGR